MIIAYIWAMPYLYLVSIVAALSGITPYSARFISMLWERFGKFLGKINSFVLLSLFFVLVVTPMGLLLRMSKKRQNKNRWQNASSQSTDFTKPW